MKPDQVKSEVMTLLAWLEARGFNEAVKEIKTTRSYERLTGEDASVVWKAKWQ